MSHMFESGVFNQDKAWHGLGVIHKDGPLYADEALEKSGLNWHVNLKPVKYNGEPVPNKFFTVRDKDDSVLGIVGSRYTPVQNHEAFTFLQDLVDNGDVEIETAIALRDGKSVVVVARRPEDIRIAGEDTTPYILFGNTHDGTTQAYALTTNVRVVCQNTLNIALDGADNVHKMRHTSGVRSKIQEARDTLQVSFDYSMAMKGWGEDLAMNKMGDAGFERFLADLFPVNDPESKRSVTVANNKRDAVREVYKSHDNLNNIRGTEWGAFNAVVEYADWNKSFKTNHKRVENILEGHDVTREAAALLGAGV